MFLCRSRRDERRSDERSVELSEKDTTRLPPMQPSAACCTRRASDVGRGCGRASGNAWESRRLRSAVLRGMRAPRLASTPTRPRSDWPAVRPDYQGGCLQERPLASRRAAPHVRQSRSFLGPRLTRPPATTASSAGCAAPATKLYSEEVAGIRRPLAVSASAAGYGETRRSAPQDLTGARRRSGRTQHSCQIALQRDVQALAIGLEHDRLDECSTDFRRHVRRGATVVQPSALRIAWASVS